MTSSYNRRNKPNDFSVTSGRDGSRSFYGEHDDRWGNNSNNRGPRGGNRGGYQHRNNRGNRGNRRPSGYRNFNSGSSRFRNQPGNTNEDDDGDVSMAGDSTGRNAGGRYNPYSSRSRGNRRGSHQDRKSSRSFQSTNPSERWFRVMIPFGAELSKDELMKLISQNIEGPFDPIEYSTQEKRAFFYVQGNNASESLRSLSRRLTKPDGHKLVFHVGPSAPPLEKVSDFSLEKLKFRMSERYEPLTQLLNLSSLYTDEVLNKENIFLALNRATTMTAVTKIVAEHIPELSGLDVSKNRMTSLGHMYDLVKATPGMTLLNLSKNTIQSVDELDKLKGWTNITELHLDGNDLCNHYSNQSAYISAVRKKFPKVIKLDGKDLPPPITFDLDTDLKVPPSQDSFFHNEEIKTLVVNFIKEYYTIYDSDKRRDLMAAYHENAHFSICTAKNILLDRQIGFHLYLDESRNLKKIGHLDSDKLLKKGKMGVLSVVSMLESIPKTTHDISSFKVDVNMASPSMLSFVLYGVFRENDTRSDRSHIRSFSRSFITIPHGSGMVITNDLLTISNAGPEQIKNAFKSVNPAPATSPSPSPSGQALPAPGVSSPPSSSLNKTQVEMVESFTAQSGMNAQFSLKCLEEHGWDYQRAGQVFTELKNQGRIPAEAFQKS